MRLIKYLFQYRIKDMVELIYNEKNEPFECQDSIEGKWVLITGATSGIGLETARLMASYGANLICINRNTEKSKSLEEELKCKYKRIVKTIIADFTSLSSLKECTKEIINFEMPLDIVIHNVGVYYTKKKFTQDNIEVVFQVNHLGAFLINFLLIDKLKKENKARIIYVNSEGHRFALGGVHLNDLSWKWHIYSGLKSYGASKTAQLLTMEKFKEIFLDSNVTINAMHPGNVYSNIGNNNGRLYQFIKKHLVLSVAKDPLISAKALLYLSASKNISGITGKFFNLTTLEKPAPHARDFSRCEAVWDKSLELCGLK